jgi:hypothetical protein
LQNKKDEREKMFNENFNIDDERVERDSRIPKSTNMIGSGGKDLAKNIKPSFPQSSST